MSQPVLFLDIDGVCNNHASQKAASGKGPGAMFDPECVRHLNTILDATGAALVLSSSWRVPYKDEIHVLDGFLHAAGLKPEYRIADVTPVLEERTAAGLYIAKSRWDEIHEWLLHHPQVDQWVILDDACDGEPPLKHYVRTDYATGLTATFAKWAIRVLQRTVYADTATEPVLAPSPDTPPASDSAISPK